MEAHLRVLGPLEVWVRGRQVALGGPRRRALLARLAIAHGSVVSTDRLIEDLWSGDAPEQARGVIQAHISTLRRELEPDRPVRAPASVLISRPPGYLLRATRDEDDFAQLVNQAAAARTGGEPVAASQSADEALGLWRGTPYEDVGDSAWLMPERQALEELYLTAREVRLATMVDLGDLHPAVLELEHLVEDHPLREEYWRLLALALYRSSRQAEALATLRRARDLVVQELGLDPGQPLRELEAAILTQDASVLGPAQPMVEVEAPEANEQTLLGRERAERLIAMEATRAAAGRLRTVLVSGEAGMGKSRVVEAAATRLATQGWRLAWGRCHEYLDAPTLWPWHQVLNDLREVEAWPPLVEATFATQSPTGPMEVAAAQFAQHQAIAAYLGSTAAQNGLVLVLEDLQWADIASLGFLEAFTDLAPTARVLVLVTYRTGEASPGLRHTLDRMARHQPARVPLEGLGAADVSRLATQVLEGVREPPDAELLVRRTGGNPFLVLETLRELAVSEHSRPLDHVPEGAAGLMRQRLLRLSAATQDVLQVAAVYGNRFDENLLATVAQMGEGGAAAAIDEATAAGLLRMSDGEHEFVHDLVRETIYADLATLRRHSLHLRIVNALENRLTVDPANVATHARKAGDQGAAAALTWASRAGGQASAGLAYDDAVRWWSVALQAHERTSPHDIPARVQLLMNLLHAQLRSSNSAAAESTWRAAVDLARQSGDPMLFARALATLDVPSVWAFRHYGDVDEQMVSLLRESLDGTALPDDLRSRLMSTLANELAYGDPALRDEASRGGMTLAPRVGDPDLRAFSLTARHLVLEATPWSETEEMRGIGQELLRIAQQGRQPGLSQQAEFVLSMAALRAFDVAEADTHVAIAAELVRRQRPSIMTRRLVVWSCARQVLAGDFVAALELLEELQTQQGMWGSSSFFSTLRAMQLVSADRASDLGGHLDAVREFHPAMANDLRILHLHAMGEHDVAAKLACAPGRPLIPSDWVAPTALVVRGLAMAACGPSDRRSQAYAQLIAGAGQIAATGSIDGGPVDWVLGQLAASQGDLWTAVEHWSRLEGLSTAAGLENWARKASWQLTTQVNQRLQAPVPE